MIKYCLAGIRDDIMTLGGQDFEVRLEREKTMQLSERKAFQREGITRAQVH